MKKTIDMFKTWTNKSNYRKRNILNRGSNFDTVKYVIPCKRLKGKKILFFTDLHIQNENFYAEELIKEINSLEANWIIHGGDLLTLLYYHKQAAKLLSNLEAKDNKFTVLGNWEEKRLGWIPLANWSNYFHSSGFTLLANSSFRANGILFTGLIPETSDFSVISKTKYNEVTCLISHKPDDAVALLDNPNLKNCFCLCGHTHGGQIRIPGFGALLTSSKYWKLFEYGHYFNKKNHTDLIVSNGLGFTGIQYRLFCKPEIVVIEFN